VHASRDTTVLIDLLWFDVVHYSSFFQYCFWSTMVPTCSSWKFLIFSLATFLLAFLETIIYASNNEMEPCAPVISITTWKVKYPRRFVASYVHPVIQQRNYCLKRSFAIKVTTCYENYGQFPLWMEAITYLPQNRHFSLWNGRALVYKSMKNALYVQQYGKRHLSGWMMYASLRQAVSQSIEIPLNKFFF